MSRAVDAAQEALALIRDAHAGNVEGVRVDGQPEDRGDGATLRVLDENGAMTASSIRVAIDPETGMQGTTITRRLGIMTVTARLTTPPQALSTRRDTYTRVFGSPDARDRDRLRSEDARIDNAGNPGIEVNGIPIPGFFAATAIRRFARSRPRKQATARR